MRTVLDTAQAALLQRHPQLITLRRSEWERAAAHLDDAASARAAGQDCPWCSLTRSTR